ncbi:protein of unknown function [Tepidibacter aestuarii]|nr:protein of unknown function [Tepidibacter aestuarii]
MFFSIASNNARSNVPNDSVIQKTYRKVKVFDIFSTTPPFIFH